MMTSTNGEVKSRATRESKDREAKASRYAGATSSSTRRGTPEKGPAVPADSPRKTRQRRAAASSGAGESGSHCLRSAGTESFDLINFSNRRHPIAWIELMPSSHQQVNYQEIKWTVRSYSMKS